jgi:hypothetical protein
VARIGGCWLLWVPIGAFARGRPHRQISRMRWQSSCARRSDVTAPRCDIETRTSRESAFANDDCRKNLGIAPRACALTCELSYGRRCWVMEKECSSPSNRRVIVYSATPVSALAGASNTLLTIRLVRLSQAAVSSEARPLSQLWFCRPG